MSEEKKGRTVTVTQALAQFFVAAFEDDFPEGHGLDGESSALCMAADLAERLTEGDACGALAMLADPGLYDSHDKLRSALHADSPQLDEPRYTAAEVREKLEALAEEFETRLKKGEWSLFQRREQVAGWGQGVRAALAAFGDSPASDTEPKEANS